MEITISTVVLSFQSFSCICVWVCFWKQKQKPLKQGNLVIANKNLERGRKLDFYSPRKAVES